MVGCSQTLRRIKMKCPKCKKQTLKEDYSNMNSNDLYCPNCDYTKKNTVGKNI